MLHEALEAHLRLHPDDWESWLVYADWLTDQGDARGELLHLEHELRLEPVPALQARLDELAADHRAEWLPDELLTVGAEIRWRHGFVHGVRLLWEPSVLAPLCVLARGRAGRFFVSLELEGTMGEEGASELAECEALAGLQELELSGCHLADEGALTLASSRWLAPRGLNACYNELEPRGAAALLLWPSLRRLNLRGAMLRGEHPWQDEPAGSVIELDLSDCYLGAREMRELAHSPALRSVKRLLLNENSLGDEGMLELIDSPLIRSLEALSLRQNRLGPESGRALASVPPPLALKWLSLDENSLGQGWEALERCTALQGCQIQ